MAQAQERRPAEGAGRREENHEEQPAAYAEGGRKASSAKSRLTAMKFKWLMQVAADPLLPPASNPIAVFIAAKFLHPDTMEAWPSIATLARLIGRSVTQTRKGLHALVERGHLDAEITVGGKGKTSRYRPIFLPVKPCGKQEGLNEPNPAENDAQTLRKMNAKPCGNPQGIPCNDPFYDSRKAHTAPSTGDHNDSSDDARKKRASPDEYSVGDIIHLKVPGDCTILKIGVDKITDCCFLAVSHGPDRSKRIIIPVDEDGTVDIDGAWPEHEDPELVDDIHWANDVSTHPMPRRPRRATHAA